MDTTTDTSTSTATIERASGPDAHNPAARDVGDTSMSDPTTFVDVLPAVPMTKAKKRAPLPIAELHAAPKPDTGAVQHVLVGNVKESPDNARRIFDDRALDELANSIEANGLLQPITARIVTTSEDDGHYELIAGARRLRAFQKLRLRHENRAVFERIPTIVLNVSDEDARALRAVENLQRADLHPIEEAAEFARLAGDGRSLAEVAALVGKDVKYVRQRVQLTHLIDHARDMALDAASGFGVRIAQEVARLTPPDQSALVAWWLATAKEWKRAPTFNDVDRWIGEHVAHSLVRAPFDTTAEDVVPGVIACTRCPHRTGVNRDLFGDIGKDHDLCMNAACFATKAKAHVDATVQALEAAGTPFARVSTHYAPTKADGVLTSKEFDRIYTKDTCDATRTAVVVEGHDRGTTFPICTDPKCKVHHVGSTARSGSTSSGDSPNVLQRRRERVSWGKRAILRAILDKTTDVRDSATLRMIAARLAVELQGDTARAVLRQLDVADIDAQVDAAHKKPLPADALARVGLTSAGYGASVVLVRHATLGKDSDVARLLVAMALTTHTVPTHATGSKDDTNAPLLEAAKRAKVKTEAAREQGLKDWDTAHPKWAPDGTARKGGATPATPKQKKKARSPK